MRLSDKASISISYCLSVKNIGFSKLNVSIMKTHAASLASQSLKCDKGVNRFNQSRITGFYVPCYPT